MAAKFEITKDKAGKFRFHLKAPNGEIIAASQGYETKASAEKGVQAIQTHAANANVEDHTGRAPGLYQTARTPAGTSTSRRRRQVSESPRRTWRRKLLAIIDRPATGTLRATADIGNPVVQQANAYSSYTVPVKTPCVAGPLST